MVKKKIAKKIAKTKKVVKPAKKKTKKPVAKKFMFDPKKHDLVLRTCYADMTSYGGFVWPKLGPVEAPDWKPTVNCGNGLHGALWGEGNGELFNWNADAVWQVVAVTKEKTIDLSGKVKFEKGFVIFTGNQRDATDLIYKNAKNAVSVIGGTASAGYGGTASAGYKGTATAGDEGTATAGDEGTATVGYGGTATAGYGGTASAGYGGTATVADFGTATAGQLGTIQISYWKNRKRIKTGYIGENGLSPNVKYKLNENFEFVKA